MAFWLVKSEAEDYPITQLAREKKTLWTGVRNYQARNFLQAMKVGEEVLYYHSNAEPSGIVGVAKVLKLAEPDPTQFDPKSDYFDEKATPEKPRWFCPTIAHAETFPKLLSLQVLREHEALKGLSILQKGTRLSVTPVSDKEFRLILKLGNSRR